MGNDLELSQGNALSVNELATTSAAASAISEIQSAIIVAKKFPRNERHCFQKLMEAARRPSFAEDAEYCFERGKKKDGSPNYVTGPSVNMAREAGRIWGNIRYGLSIVRDDDESRLIRGWAWDVETNTKVEVEDDFKKLIQRKQKNGETAWIIPDERDLRELTNRRGAILLRNALLQVMPKDLIEDALFQCHKTLENDAAEDPDRAQKRLLVDFGSLHISVDMLESRLGHPFEQSSAKELAELRGICKSIQDGHTTWAEYVKGPEPRTTDEADARKAKLEVAQAALQQQQEQPADPAPSPDPEPQTLAHFEARLRQASTAKEYALIMNEALNGPHALHAPADRQHLMAVKDQLMKRKR